MPDDMPRLELTRKTNSAIQERAAVAAVKNRQVHDYTEKSFYIVEVCVYLGDEGTAQTMQLNQVG